ncbi:MAG TPA: hypothetical protein VKV15_00730 [Bryobacteraceae bacterium]|nr:hypothetical protein [Bryobacteraceae bacterium]
MEPLTFRPTTSADRLPRKSLVDHDSEKAALRRPSALEHWHSNRTQVSPLLVRDQATINQLT